MLPKEHTQIALIGYGRMGKEIHRILRNEAYPEPIIVDPHDPEHCQPIECVLDANVCIEFSRPEAVIGNLISIIRLGVPVVCGTTGWRDKVHLVHDEVKERGGTLLYASNFSIGVQILNRLTVLAATLLSSFDSYDIAVHETHHRGKLDAPSGTALTLADIIIEHNSRKAVRLNSCPSRPIEPTELLISSSRIGSVVGRHEISMDSEVDALRIVHEAKDRSGFAEGALMAARWLVGKQGIFTFEEMFHDITGS